MMRIGSLPASILDHWLSGDLSQAALRRLAPGLNRRLSRPTLVELASCAGTISHTARDVLDRLLGDRWSAEALEREYGEIDSSLVRRCEAAGLPPRAVRVGPLTGFVLYAWTRTRQPDVVLETGVRNGCSTAILLAALRRNGRGRLHSTDVVSGSGSLLLEEERRDWSFHLLPRFAPARRFGELVDRLGRIDMFFHDSQHGYRWQRFEYHAVSSRIARDGLLASDDVDASHAFAQLCVECGRDPSILFDGYKLSGFIPWS